MKLKPRLKNPSDHSVPVLVSRPVLAGEARGGRTPRSFPTGSNPPARNGFTLIEILVVVSILAILAATIIPQFLGTTEEAKVSAAKTDVAQLQGAVERLFLHLDRYPTTDEGLKLLVEPPAGDDEKKWRGPYLRQLRPDPWGSPYQYRAPGTHNATSFDVWSRGADKADGGDGVGADLGNW